MTMIKNMDNINIQKDRLKDEYEYDRIDLPHEQSKERANVTRYPFCERCNGPHYTARVMAYCMSCMETLAREEEENCERIFREFARRSQVAKAKVTDEVKERRVAVMGRMAKVDTKPKKELKNDQIKKEQRKCDFLFCSSSRVTADMIPFHGLEREDVVNILLKDVMSRERSVVKMRIREELRRWHPDKFFQKLGLRVAEEEKEQVMEKVKSVSQALNDYGKTSFR